MTRQQNFWTVALVATVSLFLTTCNKEISVPNQDLEKLFGTWDWIESSGGYGGQTSTPSTAGYSQTVSFDKKGIYKWHKDGKEQQKRKFTLTEGSSSFAIGTANIIKYKDTKLFKKIDYGSQVASFSGQDTLTLIDECYDCYSHIYIRQK